MSSITRIWPSQAAEAPMPMVGIGYLPGDLRGKRLGNGLEHHGEGAGLGHHPRILLDDAPIARACGPAS